MNTTYPFEGIHHLINFDGCNSEALLDHASLRSTLEHAVIASGATLLNTAEHSFPNGGYTCVLLLAESHASIHTYPEHDACFLDFFTCSTHASGELFISLMRDYLRPVHLNVSHLKRGDK